VLFEIYKIFNGPIYNIFQIFRRSRQDSKSIHLHRSTSYGCVHSRECFPAFTGECQTAGKPHITVTFVFVTLYYYFQNRFTKLLTYLLTYLLTAWSRFLLEKLKGYQLAKEFPAFYRTQNFITAFISARHLSLSSARSIQSMLSIPFPEDPAKCYPPM